MIPYNRIYAAIHLDAIEDNIKAIAAGLGDGTAIMGVVKADGYGHGSVPVARVLDPYVASYAVATVEEAVLLRRHGIHKPILILGVVHESQYDFLVTYDLHPTVFQWEMAMALSERAVTAGKPVKIHLAVDTGMSRIGMKDNPAGADMAAAIQALPGIEIEGLFTHFARADEADKSWAQAQLHRYLVFLELLHQRGVEIPVKHCANSAAAMELSAACLDTVRAGIAIYGIYPSEQMSREGIKLRPAMELVSCLTYVKEIEPGVSISYGGTYTAKEKMKIGTVPVGYADGYCRNLSNCGYVLVCGQKAPIVGRICMDQMMVDVTHIPQAKEGDRVTLVGEDTGLSITMEDLAAWGGGFHYEIPCLISKRVPRVYVNRGRVEAVKDYFQDDFR